MRRTLTVLTALVMLFGATGLVSLLDGGSAAAVTITSRSITMSTAVISASANYTFTFTPGQTTQVESLLFQSCTTAVGTCTAPSGVNLSGGTVSQSSWQGATSFVKDTTTSSPACNVTTNLCAKRTDTTSQTLTAHTITDTGATNPNGTSCSTANCTFFVRISTFSDTAYSTPVDNGTVAGSTTQTLTINATIQEQLIFCIGATTIDDSNTSTPPACSGVGGTSVSLGPLSSANTSVTPVTVANGGDNNNGIAELSTNATSGAAVTYNAIQQSGTNHQGTLRVVGATCNAGSVNTDQCVNAIGTTKSTVTAGVEAFGMAVAGINCKATTAYTCSYTANSYNLRKNSTYDATGSATTYDADTGLVAGTTAGSYAWDESGTSGTVASSSTVLDKEALILKFAATPTIVTPTGSYSAQANFVATPTF
ncbi:MAG TPA: hypothetical protein VH234_04185 [Candidatus Saccharimonadales bacterium]|nr:hypothetical protein [Candidatus Saccharimonadales bacterium]